MVFLLYAAFTALGPFLLKKTLKLDRYPENENISFLLKELFLKTHFLDG